MAGSGSKSSSAEASDFGASSDRTGSLSLPREPDAVAREDFVLGFNKPCLPPVQKERPLKSPLAQEDELFLSPGNAPLVDSHASTVVAVCGNLVAPDEISSNDEPLYSTSLEEWNSRMYLRGCKRTGDAARSEPRLSGTYDHCVVVFNDKDLLTVDIILQHMIEKAVIDPNNKNKRKRVARILNIQWSSIRPGKEFCMTGKTVQVIFQNFMKPWRRVVAKRRESQSGLTVPESMGLGTKTGEEWSLFARVCRGFRNYFCVY